MKNKNLEKKLREKIRHAILEVHFVKGLNLLEREVNITLQSDKRINEGVISTAVGLLMSGPFIVKMFGKFVRFLDGIVKKFNNKGFGGQELADKIIEFSEKYHEKVLWIFKKVAGMFTKDEHKKELIADILFTGVIAAFLAHSVGDIVDAASSHFDSELIAKGIKAGVKAGEVVQGISNAFKALMPDIMSVAQG